MITSINTGENKNTPFILKGLFLIFCLAVLFYNSTVFIYAQTSIEVDTRREELQRELAELEKEIAEQQTLLQGKQRESVSLERDVSILDAQISKARLEIQARRIAITNLGSEIVGKDNTIYELDSKIEREKRALAQLLRKTRELDRASLLEIVLSNETMSDFLSDVDNFSEIQKQLSASFFKLRTVRELTAGEKVQLENKRTTEQELKDLQELEKKRIEENEAEKKRLLNITQREEAKYQKILKEQEKTAAEIRAELFRLRGTAAIPFGDALDLANFVSNETGVRPALILGVIAEESNLGENLGSGSWQTDMHPERDRPIFKKITEVLGLDPDQMPVSKKPWYGWGGAMGPAQFIPSTWACYGGFINVSTGRCGRNPDGSWDGPWEYKSDKDRIKNLLGKSSPSNPWEPRDAFMASGTLLKENGAIAGDYSSERLAALRYFAGWVNADNPSYAFYGDDVMNLASKYQAQIDILQR